MYRYLTYQLSVAWSSDGGGGGGGGDSLSVYKEAAIVESEGSLQFSQGPITGQHSEHYVLKMHFNIIPVYIFNA